MMEYEMLLGNFEGSPEILLEQINGQGRETQIEMCTYPSY